MIRIIDITEKQERQMRRARLEEQLAKECFEGKEVKLLGSVGININDNLKQLALKMINAPKMEVYDEGVLPQAETFAKKYEEQFNVKGDFIIETDYSKNR